MCIFAGEQQELLTVAKKDALLGFREWRLINGKLSSPIMHKVWVPGQPMTSGVKGPSTMSGRGVYAYQTAYTNRTGSRFVKDVSGVVLLWGKVIVFDHPNNRSPGYMAEFALPYELWVRWGIEDTATELRKKYKVPVHMGQIPRDYVAGVPA